MEYTYQDNYIKLYPSNTEHIDIYKTKAQTILQTILTSKPISKDYKILHPIDLTDFKELVELSQYIINNFKQVIIVGMGGSILNPKITSTLEQETYTKNIPIKYLDTTDQLYYNKIMDDVNLRDTYFLVISKSGTTIEVLSLLGAIIHDLNKQQIRHYNQNFCFIIGSTPSPLREIAQDMQSLILEHDPYLGGRFSTFTNIGILPGLLAGCDVKNFIEGGNKVIHSLWNLKENSIPVIAAISLLLFNKPMLINISYLKTFSFYLDWYNQIIAESLGKNGMGFTPIKSLGPMNQHSMFQLYLDGPSDKVYNFIYAQNRTKTTNFIEKNPILEKYKLAGKTLDQINAIEFSASLSYCERNYPVRKIILNELNAQNLGALAMHSILEVVILGHLMQINPFNQPSVEKIKSKVLALF
ncbi:MAG: hypothetical protein AB8U25_01460 [Rickettsiales endosymbiont of Dermacentor nuttalli]